MMEITPIRSQSDLHDAFAIRERVFVDEQACPPEEEWDEHDARSRHLLGRVGGTPVATARWRTVPHDERLVAKLERFAVLPEHRGRGYGRWMVEAAMADARRAGFDSFVLHAQAHLEDWYASMGFRATGRRFTEANIPHVEMVRLEEERKG